MRAVGPSQADQQAGIVGGAEARPPLAMADDGPIAGRDRDVRPDRIAIAPSAFQADADPVMARRRVVAEQPRRAV